MSGVTYSAVCVLRVGTLYSRDAGLRAPTFNAKRRAKNLSHPGAAQCPLKLGTVQKSGGKVKKIAIVRVRVRILTMVYGWYTVGTILSVHELSRQQLYT